MQIVAVLNAGIKILCSTNMNSRLLKYISMFIIFSLLITVGIYSCIMHTPVLKPVCRKKKGFNVILDEKQFSGKV